MSCLGELWGSWEERKGESLYIYGGRAGRQSHSRHAVCCRPYINIYYHPRESLSSSLVLFSLPPFFPQQPSTRHSQRLHSLNPHGFPLLSTQADQSPSQHPPHTSPIRSPIYHRQSRTFTHVHTPTSTLSHSQPPHVLRTTHPEAPSPSDEEPARRERPTTHLPLSNFQPRNPDLLLVAGLLLVLLQQHHDYTELPSSAAPLLCHVLVNITPRSFGPSSRQSNPT